MEIEQFTGINNKIEWEECPSGNKIKRNISSVPQDKLTINQDSWSEQ